MRTWNVLNIGGISSINSLCSIHSKVVFSIQCSIAIIDNLYLEHPIKNTLIKE